MRITIFGATGGTGKHLLEQACAAGHEVTAVVRDPARLAHDHPGLTVVTADVMDPAAIRPHVAGRDAVISAIGSRDLKPSTIQTDSTRSILDAMAAAGARRFLVVSNCGMLSDGDGPVIKHVVKPILWRILRNPWTDMGHMEEVVRASGLDWTIIRPPQLTNGPRTGRYRTAVDRNVRGAKRISRANVADCLLRELADPGSVGKAIAVAN
ncbi:MULTISPECIES: NAD(P)-dependent oxidoreductase [Saccharopolyspora]|uniref:SDR family oxidoreductase n=1 Tax=Saccharopolyspora elongata TaxID=2530387 RepID=A0A4R4Z8B2_9PSEU|nr:SDR family oxidoreductase [Saccharopolyspora elongata]TDD54405.1 SDR family oxidoreductase [Saccharopolyspora elongata]